jgi:hypothetical protein
MILRSNLLRVRENKINLEISSRKEIIQSINFRKALRKCREIRVFRIRIPLKLQALYSKQAHSYITQM